MDVMIRIRALRVPQGIFMYTQGMYRLHHIYGLW